MDEERLLHEHPMLNRLSIGLIDAGVTLTRIVPDVVQAETILAGEQKVALANRIPVPVRVLPWMRRTRANRLATAMEKSPPDVIYAIGEQAWPVAIDLGATIDRPVAINIWSAQQLRRLPRGRAARQIGCYIAATVSLVTKLRDIVGADLVSHVPMGVAIPPARKHVLEDVRSFIGVAAIGSGRDAPAYQAMLAGLSRVLRTYPQMQIMLELRGPRGHEIWRMARRLELLSAISAVQDAAQLRRLLTGCDLLVVPERLGEISSVLLECMACGMPMIAADDSYLDMLVDNETAVLVTEMDAEQWAGQMLRVLSDPGLARQLGQRGREVVAREHRSSLQIDALIETLDRLATGGNYLFTIASTEPH